MTFEFANSLFETGLTFLNLIVDGAFYFYVLKSVQSLMDHLGKQENDLI